MEDDARGHTKVVLHIRARVRKLSAQPVGLQDTQRKMLRYPEIHAAAGLDRKTAGAAAGTGQSRIKPTKTIGFANQSLREENDVMAKTPAITGTECCDNEIDGNPAAAVGGVQPNDADPDCDAMKG